MRRCFICHIQLISQLIHNTFSFHQPETYSLLLCINNFLKSLRHFILFGQYKTGNKNITELMKHNILGTNIAHQINQHLIGKVNIFIQKRDALLANMNKYSVGQLSTLMEELSRQFENTGTKSNITAIEDQQNIKMDNFMSVPQSKVYQSPQNQHSSVDSDRQRKTAKYYRKKRKMSNIYDGSFGSFERSITPNHHNIIQENKSAVELPYTPQQPEGRQFIILRLAKKHEEQEQMRRIERERIAKEKKTTLDYEGKKIMYDYDGSIVRLMEPKTKTYKFISQIQPFVEKQFHDYANDSKKIEELHKLKHCQVKQKINITIKQMEMESRKRKGGRYAAIKSNSMPHTDDSTNNLIQVNMQSHKEVENAVRVSAEGVKITLNNRDFSKERDKNTPRKMNKINRRLTRTEYEQFKAEESLKQINIRTKTQPNDKKTDDKNKQPQKQQLTKQSIQRNPHNRHSKRISLSLQRNDSASSKNSKIIIYNDQKRAQLIKQSKTTRLIEPVLTPHHSHHQSLGKIDQYNLLYVKYKGLPPPESIQKTVKQLRLQSTRFERSKQVFKPTHTSKKNSWVRENRFVLTGKK